MKDTSEVEVSPEILGLAKAIAAVMRLATPAPPTDELVLLSELPKAVSRVRVEADHRRGLIEVVRAGRALAVRRSELNRWLSTQIRKPSKRAPKPAAADSPQSFYQRISAGGSR